MLAAFEHLLAGTRTPTTSSTTPPDELATAGGYTAGGATLTTGGSSCTYDTATDEVRLDATDASWSSATF